MKFFISRHLNSLTKGLSFSSYTINSDVNPIFTVILPLHNADISLLQCLESIEKSASLKHNYFIILDSCVDKSQSIVEDFFSNSSTLLRLVNKVTICSSKN